MTNRNFQSISELQEYINRVMQLSSENIFNKYLSKIFSNLLQREELANEINSKQFSHEKNSLHYLQKDLFSNNLVPDKMKKKDLNISLNTFLDYLNIQEFIGEKIYKFLKGEKKSEKLSKNQFCEGLNHLYYGNINDLINFTFFLADFNNNGKIYKTDMKLILAYIPCTSEFSQKNYLKQINKIINIFFDEILNKDEIIYEENEQQLNLEIFQKYVNQCNDTQNKEEKKSEIYSEEFLDNYDYNAPFFYFISIISYLFKNLPFNPKTVEYFNNFNNKKKIKVGIIALERDKMEEMRKKSLINTESKMNNNFFSTKSNSFFKSNLLSTTKKNSLNAINRDIKEALPKIKRTNLFAMKKSGSQIFLKKCEVQNAISNDHIIKKEINSKNLFRSINKNDFHVTQRKGFSNQNLPNLKQFQLLNENSLENNNFRRFRKLNSIKNISPAKNDNISDSTTKNTSLFFLNKSNSNDLKDKFINLRQKLPAMLINQKKYTHMEGFDGNFKSKEEIKNDIAEPDEFMLCEYFDNDEDNRNICGKDSINSDNIFRLNEAFLYRYNDNDIHPYSLMKYYALIKEKEILFFSSEQKTDLNDIWYINKSYISTKKETILKKNYYTINITFENNFVKKLYFLNENICKSFSSSLKNVIKDYNFNDYYDLMNTVGEGHFGKVNKCKNKKTGDIFAVKIINKAKIKPKDIDLIRQEKNYLNLIKHENIIKLIDFFEDKQNIYLVTEFYEGGDLLTFIEQKQKTYQEITEKNCARIIRKIAICIHYLNLFGIIHRDLKPENIMFAKPYDFKTLKLIDLGVCQTLSYGEKAKDSIGTNGYMSPEIYLHSAYSFKIDIWSLGVVLYLLTTGGILPFDDPNLNNKNLARKVCYLQQEYPKEYFGKKSKRLIKLLDKMLEKNENKRISIDNLLKDCWFDIIKK